MGKGKKMLHITMTHTLLDEVDASFSNLDTYGEEEERTEYRVCCRELLLEASAHPRHGHSALLPFSIKKKAAEPAAF